MLLKKMILTLLPIVFTCTIYAKPSDSPNGEELYKNMCANCHGTKIDEKGPIGPALNRYSVAQLIQVMATSKKTDGKDIPMMIGVKGQLKTEEQRKAIAEFIVSKGKKK